MNNEQKAQLLPSASLEQNGVLGDVPVVPFGKYELKDKSKVSYFKTFPDREIFECTLLGINFKDETMLLRIWYYGWSSPDWIDEYVHYSNVRHIAQRLRALRSAPEREARNERTNCRGADAKPNVICSAVVMRSILKILYDVATKK